MSQCYGVAGDDGEGVNQRQDENEGAGEGRLVCDSVLWSVRGCVMGSESASA